MRVYIDHRLFNFPLALPFHVQYEQENACMFTTIDYKAEQTNPSKGIPHNRKYKHGKALNHQAFQYIEGNIYFLSVMDQHVTTMTFFYKCTVHYYYQSLIRSHYSIQSQHSQHSQMERLYAIFYILHRFPFTTIHFSVSCMYKHTIYKSVRQEFTAAWQYLLLIPNPVLHIFTFSLHQYNNNEMGSLSQMLIVDVEFDFRFSLLLFMYKHNLHSVISSSVSNKKKWGFQDFQYSCFFESVGLWYT